MKKVSLLILVSLILLLAFTSCDMLPESVSGKLEDFKVKVEIMIGLHEHAWTEATCESAKTCETCGEIEGEALGHNWSDATCDAPKTCSVCAKTEGAALGHEWVDATCDTPKTCSVCKKTEGAALGHKWTAASCDSAKTCSVCGETDGAALGHAFTNYVSNGDATCTADGTKTAKCDRCDVTDTITDEGTALGHIYTYECDAHCERCHELTNENAAHKAVLVPAVEPTCTTMGNNAYYTCELCGNCWKDAELKYNTNRLSEILDVVDHQYFYPCDPVCMVCNELTNPEAAHSIVYVEAKAATCTENGNNAYYTCEHCGNCWKDEALIQMTNRFYEIIVAPGHQYTYACDAQCNVCYEITNPEAAHTITHVEAKAATCFEDGNLEYWTCSDCGYCWLDEELTMNAVAPRLVVPAEHKRLAHQEAIEPACHFDGQLEHWICYDCELVWTDEALTQQTNIKRIVVPALGGDVIHVEAVAPTCNSEGNIEYWYCEDCMQVWQDEALTQLTNMMRVKLSAGHTNLQHFEAVAPGCHYTGNIEYWHCYDCETVWTDEALTLVSNVKNVIVPATGEGDLHHFEAIEPGCHYDGNVEYWHCYDCEQVWTDEALTLVSNVKNVILPATNDPAAIHVEAKPATCYENGNIEYWYCEQCGQVWQDEARTQLTNIKNVIVPAGHTNLVHMDAVEAGCHYTGNTEYWICYGCEIVWADEALTQITNVKNVIIPAKGSNLLVHNEAIEPGCHYDGQIEHWHCYECEQVWTDEALTQLSNVKNVILPATNDPAAIHVEAVAASCTENGNIEYWYCENCEQVWADEALTQLTNRKNVILPAAGHNYTESTCQTLGACTVCGESDTEYGCHALEYDVFDNKFYCVTDGCDASFTPDYNLVYDGSNTNWDFALNDGNRNVISIDVNDNGEYHISSNDPEKNPQYMVYIPHSNRTNENIIKDFTCANNAFGAVSFRIKTNLQSAFRFIAMEARNGNSTWDADGSWAGNSIDILAINPASEGVSTVVGGNITGDVLGTANVGEDGWTEWIDIKMFIHLTDDNMLAISYYINGEFSNVYHRDLANPPEGKQTLTDFKIECFYMCGNVKGENAGVLFDDLVISYSTNSDWHFDGHKHVWVDATCTDAQYCELCGEIGEAALDHTAGEVVKENVVLPNCTETGSHDDVVYCTVCGAEVSRTPVVDAALGHTEEVVPGYAATCTEYGLSDGAKCSVCGVTTRAQESIDPLRHVDEDGDELCDVCGADLACKHPTTEPVEGKAPTCTATGLTAAEKCTVCQEIIGQEVIPALDHTAAEAVAEEVVPPTCTEAGSHYDAVYCSVCNELISRTKVVDAALDHDYIDNAAQAPDCTNAGWDAYQTCSRCDYTTKVEIAALGHDLSAATCQAGQACSRCDYIDGEANPVAHVLVHDGATNTYSCELCEYSYKIKVGNYSDGTNYNGISANAPNNTTYYTTNPDNNKLPVLAGDYLEFVRKTDAEGVDNTVSAQLQLWLPSTGGSNMFAGFSAANHANGYLSFSINACTDKNLEMKLVDNTTDNVDVDGDGVTENIRWGDLWAINDPVFRITPPANGKVELKGFNGVSLAVVDVDENNYSGWVDVAINIVLDPDTDTVIANYYINGSYVISSSRPLSIHSNSINAVYLNSNNTAAGTGYKIDNLAFGYTAHTHDLEITEANGVLSLVCACGTTFSIDEYKYFVGANKTDFTYGTNGTFPIDVNKDGQYVVLFTPEVQTTPEAAGQGWATNTNNNKLGGQHMFWIPSNAAGQGIQGFSCANNAVGVISFKMKTNVDDPFTIAVAKERGATDWGSWGDSSTNLVQIGGYDENGIYIKNLPAGAVMTTIPVVDGWSEWFELTIIVQLSENGNVTYKFYVNNVLCGSWSGAMNINSLDIRALYINGWTYTYGTGIMLDDIVFGYTAGGHNTLDGQYHKLTETTCGEKSTCVCGWTGYTVAHDLTEATCGAPATCKGCGMTVGSALTHNNLTASANNGVVTYNCADCGKQYVLDGGMHDVNDMAVANADSSHTYTLTDGTYSVINGGIANGQHQFWVPGQTESPELADFTNANNALGFLSFSINANDHHNTGIEFKINANRGQGDWNGPTNNGWSDSSVGVFKVMPTAAGATTVALTGYNGASLGSIAVTGADGWTGWINVVIKMQLTSDNKISLDYYINGAYYANITGDMVIHTYEINSLYIAGRTAGEGQGYELKDVYFGYTLNGLQEVKEPFYTSEIAAEDVTSDTLKTLVASKIKQYDQCTAVNTQGGTPVYVLADKNGEQVEALYFSRTYAWAGTESEQFSEFRFAVNGEQAGPAATKISFDYKIDGTVEKNERHEFTGLKGEKFYADAYVQVKTPATHELATDNYPELSGTDLVLDGEWHTMTYTFDEPLVIIDILLNLHHFQGELLISNLAIEYAE